MADVSNTNLKKQPENNTYAHPSSPPPELLTEFDRTVEDVNAQFLHVDWAQQLQQPVVRLRDAGDVTTPSLGRFWRRAVSLREAMWRVGRLESRSMVVPKQIDVCFPTQF